MIVAYRGRSYLYTEDVYYLYLLHDVEREHRHCSVLDMVIPVCTDCIGSCKSNYDAITTTTKHTVFPLCGKWSYRS